MKTKFYVSLRDIEDMKNDFNQKESAILFAHRNPLDLPYVKVKICKIEKRYIHQRSFSNFRIKYNKIKHAFKNLIHELKES
jgi:hypothetical protein